MNIKTTFTEMNEWIYWTFIRSLCIIVNILTVYCTFIHLI